MCQQGTSESGQAGLWESDRQEIKGTGEGNVASPPWPHARIWPSVWAAVLFPLCRSWFPPETTRCWGVVSMGDVVQVDT